MMLTFSLVTLSASASYIYTFEKKVKKKKEEEEIPISLGFPSPVPTFMFDKYFCWSGPLLLAQRTTTCWKQEDLYQQSLPVTYKQKSEIRHPLCSGAAPRSE